MYQSNAFARPRIQKELAFLAALERGEVVTQIALSKRVAVSVGLINALLKRAVRKGYVKAKAASYKRYAYYLTPQGFAEKSRLVAQYLEASLSFFRQAKQEYSDVFIRAHSLGMRRIGLIGEGELAEIALLAAQESGVRVDMILERATTNKDQLHGISVVRSPDELSAVDGAVITDANTPQETFDILRRHFAKERILVPPLLHVTDAPINCKLDKRIA